MATHQLKTWTAYFRAIEDGLHTFTFRKDDRAFAEGDWLILEEFDVSTMRFTGRTLTREVAYVLRGGHPDSGFGAIHVETGFAILGLRAPAPSPWPAELPLHPQLQPRP